MEQTSVRFSLDRDAPGAAANRTEGLSLSLLTEADASPGLGRPLEFAQKNFLNPLVNHAILEPYNTVASLVEREPGALQSRLLTVAREDFLSAGWFAQTVSSGVGAVLPYAIAGKTMNCGLRRIGATVGAEGVAAKIFKNETIANVAGAALYDGFRPLREGESRVGNIAGGAAAFTVFGIGNHWGRNLTGGWKIAGRGAAGFLGADAQLLVSRYATNGALPKAEELLQAGIAGSFMNNLLPPLQDGITRKLSEAKYNMGFSTPADRYAATHLSRELAADPTLVARLEQHPWIRVQKGLHNDFSSDGHGVIKLAPGRNGAEELVRGLARMTLSKEAPHETSYREAARLVKEGNAQQAWETFKQARAVEETAAHNQGQIAANRLGGRPVLSPENLVQEMAAWPAPGGMSFEMRWRQEFQQFMQSGGQYRPGRKFTGEKPFVPKESETKPVDRSQLSEQERVLLEQRDTAVGIVGDLQKAGFIAAFAGGAVRDEYRGVKPKDYDIATSATPEQITEVFSAKGYKLDFTGKQFGVVRVRINGVDYEIATLRNDGNYTDGRRPDAVEFVPSLVEDAARRDLTVNAMFKDPVSNLIFDFFGGRRDLDAKVLRTVGDASQRFREDYLRMPRVARLLSTKFSDFTVYPDTVEGLRTNADKISSLAAERVREEMRLMLLGKNPLMGLDLMMDTGLMKHLLPEVEALQRVPAAQEVVMHAENTGWQHTRRVVGNLAGKGHRFETMLSGLFAGIGRQTALPGEALPSGGHAEAGAKMFKGIAGRLKLSNLESRDVQGTLARQSDMQKLPEMTPAEVKRVLNLPYAEDLFALQHADAMAAPRTSQSMLDFVRAKQLEYANGHPAQRLDAQPLINGDLLITLGIKPGQRMGQIKNAALEAQMNGAFSTSEAAMEWLAKNVPEFKPATPTSKPN